MKSAKFSKLFALWRSRVSHGVLTVCLGAVAAQAADWPQWRGPNRNGISTETGWLDQWPPSGVWTQQVGMGYSAVSVSTGRVYTMGYKSGRDYVYCFDAVAGTQGWVYSYSVATNVEFDGPRATPTVDGGRVYTYNHEGRLYCLDAVSGSKVWNKLVNSGRPTWGFSSSPLIEGNLVIVNAGGAGTAVSKDSPNNVAWTSSGDARYASPVAFTWNAKRVVAVFSGAGLFGLDPLNGRTNWWFSWSSYYNAADPIVHGDKIFVTENGTRYECAAAQLGTNQLRGVWTNTQMRSECATPILLGDYLYGFDYGDFLCMDIRDGSVVWSKLNLFNSEGTMIAADGRLIILNRKGELLIVKATPAGYDPEGRVPVPIMPDAQNEESMTAPVLANGKLYCRSHQGTLVCLQMAGKPSDGDGDGMADTWEQVYLGGTTNDAGTGDRDRDRCPDLYEYVTGTDPTNAQSGMKLGLTLSSGGVIISWPTRPVGGIGYDESQSRLYLLESATNLTTGQWLPVAGYTNIAGSGGTVAYTNLAGVERWYRVNVRLR